MSLTQNMTKNKSKKYKYLFFDLDGTLTDSKAGVMKSMQFALSQLGVGYDGVDFDKFLGPPISESFGKFFGKDEDKIQQAIVLYRQRYEKTGMLNENGLYPGIRDMLEALAEAGCVLSIVTSKPLEYARVITGHFGIDPFITGLYGPDLDKGKGDHRKADALLCAINDMGAPKAEAVMIGDRMYDMEAANETGIDAAGVLYGYGRIEELSEYKPAFMAQSVEILRDWLLNI